jgi:hypothetical protein
MARITVEQARSLLEIPNVRGNERLYYQAVVEGTLPQYYLDRFIDRRDNFSNEIPLEDVGLETQHQVRLSLRRPGGPISSIQYKIQTNFVTGFLLDLDGAIKNEAITNKTLIEEIRVFRESDLNFEAGDPKNVERLAHMNGILNEVIAYLAPIGTPEQRQQAATFFFT